MRQAGTVFFLHLLGLDTTGHAYRPNGVEYYNNLVVVDDLVQRVEARFAQFFADDRTAFVFTADHGMSNIGNHGDGHPDNTRTPLIAWGAGVRPAQPGVSGHDELSSDWGLDTERQDVEQADVAALMVRTLGRNLAWP